MAPSLEAAELNGSRVLARNTMNSRVRRSGVGLVREARRSAFLLTFLLLAACDRAVEESAATPVSALLGGTGGTEGFARAERGVPISLPADHGAHEAFRSEWWYFTAVLSDASGSPFGVQFTIFRQALRPTDGAPPECAWCTDQAWLGHVAITDVDREQHEHVERLSRGSPERLENSPELLENSPELLENSPERRENSRELSGLAGARAEPFAVWVDGLSASSNGEDFLPLRLFAHSSDLELDLRISDGGRLVMQGDSGFSAKGPDQASHYFSMTRLPVSGTLRLFDRSTTVTGTAWLDREWSTSVLSGGQRGWDWLALQLDDGRDVMAFRLRRADASRDPFDQAIVIKPNEERRYSAEQFSLEPTRFWADEYGAQWPVSWQLRIGAEVFGVDAMIDDQLMRTMVRYWEGLVRVSDDSGVKIGRGYLELTGYEQYPDADSE